MCICRCCKPHGPSVLEQRTRIQTARRANIASPNQQAQLHPQRRRPAHPLNSLHALPSQQRASQLLSTPSVNPTDPPQSPHHSKSYRCGCSPLHYLISRVNHLPVQQWTGRYDERRKTNILPACYRLPSSAEQCPVPTSKSGGKRAVFADVICPFSKRLSKLSPPSSATF